ncbi:hypothetical protein Micbo1qcDRAFT_158523 [Microdochium bolleyi]|uniref:Erythromycin biosynthesis protein CIII-like C-terminal domain-containing protein n=1 Tax=Microdochium bolleyi TaxID=196109 RepID=A0A136J946_9PEZI|nr:hypothetical protein Micbo1qcDRAFT_158523 [Microdochium bolleyi]
MTRRTPVAAVVALLAVLLGFWWTQSLPSSSPSTPVTKDRVAGKNNTILFLTTETHGTSNAHVATAFALAQRHPGADVHYASFPALAPRIARVAAIAASSRPDHDISSGPLIKFHTLAGASYRDVTVNAMQGGSAGLVHAPGLRGAAGFCTVLSSYALDSWPDDDHVAQYHSARAAIDAVDPSLVVADMLLGPSFAALRDARRKYVVLSPNSVSGSSPNVQPPHAAFWKYPFLASGIAYPMKTPRQLLTNLVYTFKMIRCVIQCTGRTAQRAPALQARGVESVPDFTNSYDPAVPWIAQTVPGAHFDLLRLPDNVILAGTVNLDGVEDWVGDGAGRVSPVVEWVRRGPTMLINMGSMYEFVEPQLRVMAGAIEAVLREVSDVQVLWKVKLSKNVVGPESEFYGNDAALLASLCEGAQKDGRVKIERWLDVEPPTLLREEQLVAYVHHGGAGGYNDALGAGVPQVVLPQWADLYDYATLVEYLGIGIWPCQDTSPYWEVGCLSSAMIELLSGRGAGEADSSGRRRRAKAAKFEEEAKKQVGRDVAAREIARLAST